MQIIRVDFNAKVGKNVAYKPMIGKHSLHVVSNGITRKQIDYFLINARRKVNCLDLGSLIEADGSFPGES